MRSLKLESEIGGVNTKVAAIEAQLQQARACRGLARSTPGLIFKGMVDQIWRANAAWQYLPSDVLRGFDAADTTKCSASLRPKSISMTRTRRSFRLASGVGAIYTGGGGFAVLRKISIRAHSWLYPLNV